MRKKMFFLLLFTCRLIFVSAETPFPIKQLLKADYMRGASFSCIAIDMETGEIAYQYDPYREMVPASVMKIVTTATALELLGDDFRFSTSLEYSGDIQEGILHGNLYIRGGGDPTLGSAYFTSERNSFTADQQRFLTEWIDAIKSAGIRKIEGAVISDESIFDSEGLSPKWVKEDLGNYYGAGSYGLNVFDNNYHIRLTTGEPNSSPTIKKIEPSIKDLVFHNYLLAASVPTDSAYIFGAPFSKERYLYGIIPANRDVYTLKGDIPDPALFLAERLTSLLEKEGIIVQRSPSCYRIEQEMNRWEQTEKREILTTYSPKLTEIIPVINKWSHNLYADVLLKTIGLHDLSKQKKTLSSFRKGVEVLQDYWKNAGLDVQSLHPYDGCGLAVDSNISAAFLGEMLVYMAKAPHSESFYVSLPLVGKEGTVRNFLRGSSLEGKGRLKSGSMNRVRCYAGYINKEGKKYAVALMANKYNCNGQEIARAFERLLIDLF